MKVNQEGLKNRKKKKKSARCSETNVILSWLAHLAQIHIAYYLQDAKIWRKRKNHTE